jgi:SSS family solute:Na+ symporter
MAPQVRYSLGWFDIAIIAFPIVLAFLVTLHMRRFTRSVTDFLAAGRSAGRYLICTAQMEMGITAIGVVEGMETFSQTGFSLRIWQSFTGFFMFLMAMSGLISYRFRETRSLTFHQFFEVRYSKGVRVFATMVQTFSSLLQMGIGPAIASRFFVYYLGMPPTIHLGTITVPTMAVLMVAITALSLYFAFSGGQLTIMTTDAIEGVISSILYLFIAFSILWLFSYHQMGAALSVSRPGESYLDPFDVSKRPDFNYTFVVLGWAMNVYYYRGNAWSANFAASAKSAHESQMSVVLSVWRSMAASAMGGLIGLGAFTLIHSPDFAGHAEAVKQYLLRTIPDKDIQLRSQLLLPTALGVLLPAGVKGALGAVLLMGLVASNASGLLGFSGMIVQDLILPYKKKRIQPATHIRILRITSVILAVYSIFFGLIFRFTDYLAFVTSLLSAVYLAGIGCVVWGGLYWKKSTRQGAWASIVVGLVLASAGILIQQFWISLVPWLIHVVGPGPRADYLQENGHNLKFPINGQIISAVIYAICLIVFIVVSLATCKVPYDLDKLLHRGKYQAPGEKKVTVSPGFSLKRLAGINENFTRGDRRIAYFTLWWGLIPIGINAAVVFMNVVYKHWTLQAWWRWNYFWAVLIPIVGGVITTIWFTWGVTKDMRQLFRDLKSQRIDVNDDGQVHAAPPDIVAHPSLETEPTLQDPDAEVLVPELGPDA